MAENVPVGDAAKPAMEKRAAAPARHAQPGGGTYFHNLVHARATAHGHANRGANHGATPRGTASHNGAAAHQRSADAALNQAMKLEAVPDSWHAGLEFLMMQESGGRVGVHNPASSARGLFQLTASNYHLNPHGVHSFGNGVEEAQGGIRYVEERYGTVDNAVAHWRARRSY